MHDQLRIYFLHWWSSLVSRRPGWVLSLATIAAISSLVVTFGHLRFESDRNRLISDDLEWNQWFNDWRVSFHGSNDLIVVVDTWRAGVSSSAHRAKAQRLVDVLAHRLGTDLAYVHAVVWGFDRRQVGAKALRALNWDQFEAQVIRLEQSLPLLASARPVDLITNIQAMFKPSPSEITIGLRAAALPQSVQPLTTLVNAFNQVLATPRQDRPDLAAIIDDADNTTAHWRYLESQPDGRFLFIRITPQEEASTINSLAASIRSIRGAMKDVAQNFPDVAFGLTGIEVVEADETNAITYDTAIASVAAFVLISVLLVTAFYSWRTPLLALLALLYGITWTFGYLTLVIGHLQVVSVVFCVILMGLGIAYGIHLVVRFELVRHSFSDGPRGFAAAMQDSFTTMGPGIITGAVTTAVAFVTTMFTDFKGVGEMGMIAAGGVMLCLTSMFSVFPALLRLIKPRHKHIRPMESRLFHYFEDRWVMPFVRWPRLTLVVSGSLACVSLLVVVRWMHFDYDLMALQPRGVESVRWQQQITRFGGRSIFTAVCIVDDMEDAWQLTDHLRDLETIEDVGGVGLLFPKDDKTKRVRLEAARGVLNPFLAQVLNPSPAEVVPPTNASVFIDQFGSFTEGLNILARLSPDIADLAEATGCLVQTCRALPDEVAVQRLTQLDAEYALWREHTAQQIAAAVDTGPLCFEDLPADLMRPYRDDAGRFVLEIYPNISSGNYASPLDPQFMRHFIGEVRLAIDDYVNRGNRAEGQGNDAARLTRQLPRALASMDNLGMGLGHPHTRPILTGPLVQFYKSGELILSSYCIAAIAALTVVFLLVLVDFQRGSDALLALVPVGMGFSMTFAVMWVIGETINPANIIVLPLMFGIGVDSGVHVLHRFRQDNRTRPLGLTSGTGKSITITSLTTMIGFGTLMLARHQGIFSLGLVMTVGIGLTMILSLTVMPAWLELRQKSLDS